MSYASSSSAPSVSVRYGTMDIGLFPQEGKEIKYTSIEQIGKIIQHMPDAKKKTLLAPIEQGLIDPQSVFYLIDDKNEGQIAICVEDFVQLAYNFCSKDQGSWQQQQIGAENSGYSGADISTAVPPRLLDALQLMTDRVYTSIEEDSSSGYSSHDAQTRSRVGSAGAFSEGSYNDLPPLPKSRPPSNSFSLSVGSFVNMHPNPDSENADSWTKRDSFSGTSSRKPSTLESQSRKTSVETQDSKSSSSLLRKVSLNSSSGIKTLHNKEHKETILCPASFRRHPVRFILLSIAACILAAGAAIGVYRLSSHSATNDFSTTTTLLFEYAPYDCVAGSEARVLLDGEPHTLVSLKLPEKLPTHSVQSHQYLFVTQKAQWWHAIKYCTAWCGYLVAINTQEESDIVLEMVEKHRADIISYWIGFKAWKGAWYLDDESNVTFYNFPNHEPPNQNINGIDDIKFGCVQSQANDSGIWSLYNCDATLPFVCERNVDDKNIRRTPFYPHQEKSCSQAGGRCKYVTDCIGHDKTEPNLCPLQPNNIACCIPNKPKPQQLTNSSIQTCAEAGGICNHVDADQCRNGRVVFGLNKPCPDHPRKLDCCVENDT